MVHTFQSVCYKEFFILFLNRTLPSDYARALLWRRWYHLDSRIGGCSTKWLLASHHPIFSSLWLWGVQGLRGFQTGFPRQFKASYVEDVKYEDHVLWQGECLKHVLPTSLMKKVVNIVFCCVKNILDFGSIQYHQVSCFIFTWHFLFQTGTVCSDTLNRSYTEWAICQYKLSEMCKEEPFTCPACTPQMLAVAVDGNRKQYRFKKAGK